MVSLQATPTNKGGKHKMPTNSDIPEDLRESAFREYVRIVTADAVIACQYVERTFNAICLVLNVDGLQFSVEDFLSNDSSRMRQTLGKIKSQLKSSNCFNSSFCERLSDFNGRRNRVVHGLFADTFQSHDQITSTNFIAQEYVRECKWVSDEAAELVEIGFGIHRALGIIELSKDPENQETKELMQGFDDFKLVGLSTLKPTFKSLLNELERFQQ
ncbi:hypothetical protein [Phormidesmis priestleyi]|uniref:hypothetical protein n=1 Tax=Phormidesmis priestleyi TaxID=268141 RepID=UPI00083B5F4B|nr:hypothetical protein [Phormidesmis priestleyi]